MAKMNNETTGTITNPRTIHRNNRADRTSMGDPVARARWIGLKVALTSVRKKERMYPRDFRLSQGMIPLRAVSMVNPHSGQRSLLRLRRS